MYIMPLHLFSFIALVFVLIVFVNMKIDDNEQRIKQEQIRLELNITKRYN
jgi:hypothetical protein